MVHVYECILSNHVLMSFGLTTLNVDSMNDKLWKTAFGYTSVFNSGCFFFCIVADRNMDSYISYRRFCLFSTQLHCWPNQIHKTKFRCSSLIAPSDPGHMEIATKLCLNTGIDSCTKFSLFGEVLHTRLHSDEQYPRRGKLCYGSKCRDKMVSCSENAPFKVISVLKNMLLILANTLLRFLILIPEILINLYTQITFLLAWR